MRTIEKEQIHQLRFSEVDKIISKEEQKLRISKLKRAEQLGNIFKQKAKIFFNTMDGIFKVETTVWATTENYVALKGGVLIPIHCIDKVEFY